MDKIVSESSLEKLSQMLQREKSDFLVAIPYLRSLRNLYHMMVSKSLVENWEQLVKEFQHYFDLCYAVKLVNMTPKVFSIFLSFQLKTNLLQRTFQTF